MSYRKLGIIVLLCLLAMVGALMYVRDNFIEKPHWTEELTDLTELYAADEEILEAQARLAEGTEPAEVITTLQDGSPRVALVFDGLPSRPLTARLLDVLARYGAEAVFFAEGENAADQPETMTLIQEAGQEVGNYTFVGVAEAQKLPPEDLVRELCRTQKVIAARTAQSAELFRAPRTVYTDPLLQAVKACGLACAVKENVRYQPGSLTDGAAATAYAASIQPGSIIAIPVGHPVERLAQEEGKTNERPAVDMQPTIKDGETEPPRHEHDLADEMELLLAALQQKGYQAVFVNKFRRIRYIPAPVPALPGLPQPGSQEVKQ